MAKDWTQEKAIEALEAENARLRAALREISTYEIDEGCPCKACQHSALARAALETPTPPEAHTNSDEGEVSES